MKKIASLIVAISVLALVSCGSGNQASGPAKAVKTYLDYVKDGKYGKAISCYQQAAELQAFEGKMEESMDKQGGLKSFVLGEETMSEDGNSATVEAILTHGNGEVETQTLRLNKIDGEWKIDATAK
jgi:hypothetical protein